MNKVKVVGKNNEVFMLNVKFLDKKINGIDSILVLEDMKIGDNEIIIKENEIKVLSYL